MNEPSLRDSLRVRQDVADDEIDAIIGLAGELSDAAREAQSRLSLDDVRDIARDVDIAPEFVERAIAVRKERRAQEVRDAEEAAALARERGRRWRGVAIGVGIAAVAGVAVLLALGSSAASRVDAARADLSAAEAQVSAALDRQAALVPQLLAAAGANVEVTRSAAAGVANAADLESRLAASKRLQSALTDALGALPPTDSADKVQARQDLRYELTGAANRVAAESRRLATARAEVERASRGFSARVAAFFGMTR
ncbi:MAG: hypothetical protein R3F39_23300 [Myxococcota bacterium]